MKRNWQRLKPVLATSDNVTSTEAVEKCHIPTARPAGRFCEAAKSLKKSPTHRVGLQPKAKIHWFLNSLHSSDPLARNFRPAEGKERAVGVE